MQVYMVVGDNGEELDDFREWECATYDNREAAEAHCERARRAAAASDYARRFTYSVVPFTLRHRCPVRIDSNGGVMERQASKKRASKGSE